MNYFRGYFFMANQVDGKAFFQFQVKRGPIDTTDLDHDDRISLCQ
mgnify:CR=1 FL=1